jgi:putative transposase
MRQIDRQYTRTPFYGSRRMTVSLNGAGYAVNRKRVQRLMQLMGLEAVRPVVHIRSTRSIPICYGIS